MVRTHALDIISQTLAGGAGPVSRGGVGVLRVSEMSKLQENNCKLDKWGKVHVCSVMCMLVWLRPLYRVYGQWHLCYDSILSSIN